jgi:predicted house-cleaning noncanonical NTP pyrophosphatase (MazG superfamily)
MNEKPKYSLIRDNLIKQYPDDLVEVCDNRFEILQFGLKECFNLLMELQETDGRDLDAYADIFEILYTIAEVSNITEEEIHDMIDYKLDQQGGYSIYLKRK